MWNVNTQKSWNAKTQHGVHIFCRFKLQFSDVNCQYPGIGLTGASFSFTLDSDSDNEITSVDIATVNYLRRGLHWIRTNPMLMLATLFERCDTPVNTHTEIYCLPKYEFYITNFELIWVLWPDIRKSGTEQLCVRMSNIKVSKKSAM